MGIVAAGAGKVELAIRHIKLHLLATVCEGTMASSTHVQITIWTCHREDAVSAGHVWL